MQGGVATLKWPDGMHKVAHFFKGLADRKSIIIFPHCEAFLFNNKFDTHLNVS
jgi:hypothetical protein